MFWHTRQLITVTYPTNLIAKSRLSHFPHLNATLGTFQSCLDIVVWTLQAGMPSDF